jgi:hypothetical protein
MKLIIKTLTKEILELEVKDDSSIDNVKSELASLKTVDPECIRLIFNGRIMENGKMLCDYQIVDKSILVMMISKQKVAPVEPSTSKVIDKPTTNTPDTPVTPVTQMTSGSVQPSSIPASIPTSIPTSVPASIPTLIPLQESNTVNDLNGNLFDVIIPTTGATTPITTHESLVEYLKENKELFIQLLLQSPAIKQLKDEQPDLFEEFINDENFINNILNMGQVMNNMGQEMNDIGHEMDNMMDPNVVQIELTDSEVEDVTYLKNLGINQMDALQYYIACGKNKEMAANMIMDDLDDVDDLDEVDEVDDLDESNNY